MINHGFTVEYILLPDSMHLAERTNSQPVVLYFALLLMGLTILSASSMPPTRFILEGFCASGRLPARMAD
jgi:hypothetical protein